MVAMPVLERAREEVVAGLRTRVVSVGPPSPQALPVVVLHGWGASLDAIVPIVNGLSATLAVLALDLPGFGQAEPPPRAWSVDDYAEHVLRLCDAHGHARFSVVGHSNGARIAIALASSHPERVGRMVLTGAAGIKPRRKPSYYGKVAVAKAGRVVGTLGGAPGRRLQERMRRRVASQDWLDASEAMRGTLRAVLAEDLSPRLASIEASTVLVWGEDDADTPLWMGERMERAIPDAALIKLKGGHYVYAERAAEFNRIAEHFLAQAH